MEGDLIATDAPVDSGIDTQIDDAPDNGAPADGAPPADDAQVPVEGEIKVGEKPVTPGRPIVDGHLSPEFKTIYDKMKVEAPAMARAVMSALQFEDRFRKEVPGGLKEVQQLREHIEKLGGEQGIQDLTGELDGWREFDEKFTAGDPDVIKFLTETPEASAAFLKIAPLAFEKFRELHPEGYGAYVSQVFLGDMQQAQIPLLIDRLQDFIPADNQRAMQIWKSLSDYVNRVAGMASKAVAAPAAKAAPQDDKRAQELTQRETNLRQQEWYSGAEKAHGRMFAAAWKQQIGERKLTTDQRESINELYGLRLKAILKESHPKFDEQMRRYFANGQLEGFNKLHASTFADAVPKALRAVIQRVLGAKPGPATGTPKPGTTTTAAQKPAQGFTFLNAKPKMMDVDRVKTTPDMWAEGKAIMADGKRVQWKV